MERQNKPKQLVVSFYCAQFQIDAVEELLATSGFGSIRTDGINSARDLLSGGKIIHQSGILFSGVITEDRLAELLSNLSERKIAGYSRETQVLSSEGVGDNLI